MTTRESAKKDMLSKNLTLGSKYIIIIIKYHHHQSLEGDTILPGTRRHSYRGCCHMALWLALVACTQSHRPRYPRNPAGRCRHAQQNLEYKG